MNIVRTEDEIYSILDWAMQGISEGTHYAGMSYEQGIQDMYAWLTGENDISPEQE